MSVNRSHPHPHPHQTPVHKCAINDRSECLDALIEAKADPDAVFLGERAISIAARQNRDHILKRLVDYSATKLDVKNETGGSVLHFAAAVMVDSPESVDILIKVGLDINGQDQRGNTPVMVACFFNKPAVVKSFVNAKANLTIQNNEEKDAAALCDERESTECKAALQLH